MKQPSSPSEGPGLLGALFSAPGVAAELGDHALIRALLDVEAALALASAEVGAVPVDAAEAIAEVCGKEPGAELSPFALGQAAVASGNPVVPLVRALEAELPASAAPWIHHGATSQDILDTALMLIVQRACGPLLTSLWTAADALADLTARHQDTPAVARTLGQQALPTTFGLTCAGWLTAVDTAAAKLARVRTGTLAVQFGGAAGTLAALGRHGPAVADALARRLGLAAPALPWHADRQRILNVADALAGAAAALGKIAGDVVLLAQSEVAEVAEGGSGGGSSAMPQKRNPVSAILVRSAAIRAPGLLATLHTAATLHEHQRAAGGWHAEWEPLRELTDVVGGAAARAATMLTGLTVDTERMRANLDAAGPALLAESISGALAPSLGRAKAHDVVRKAVRSSAAGGSSLRQILLESDEVRAGLDADELETALDAALDPLGYLGSAGTFVDRALAAHAAATLEDR
jgi:3-carboxy-cis,cis-muconate cycloisomerase